MTAFSVGPAMNPAIDEWFSDLTHEQREIAFQLRELVLTNGENLREELKWNQPCFYGSSMICYIQKAKRHVSLGFGKGAELADPKGLLEGSGGQMRHVKVPFGTTADRGVLAELVKEAVALDSKG